MSLSLAMTVLLAACGSGGNGNSTNTVDTGTPPDNEAPPAEVEELTPEEGAMLTIWDGGDQKGFVEQAAAAFEEKYGVKVS